MFKKYQKLIIYKTICGTSSNYVEVIYLADYIGFEKDANLNSIPQTKLIVSYGNNGTIYHISPMDIVEIVDGID